MIEILASALPPMHYIHALRSEGITFACGAFWKRGEAVMRCTSQAGDVTCEECAKTMRAAGVSWNDIRGT